MKTLFAALLAVAIILALITFDLALRATFSFDALTCADNLSCADLYITCQGSYLCQDEACSVMECFGAVDTGPRHGAGFVWLLGSVFVPAYAYCLARLSVRA